MGSQLSQSQQLNSIFPLSEYEILPPEEDYPSLTFLSKIEDNSLHVILQSSQDCSNTKPNKHKHVLNLEQTHVVNGTKPHSVTYKMFEWATANVQGLVEYVTRVDKARTVSKIQYRAIVQGAVRAYHALSFGEGSNSGFLHTSIPCLNVNMKHLRIFNEIVLEKSKNSQKSNTCQGSQLTTEMIVKVVSPQILHSNHNDNQSASSINKDLWKGVGQCIHKGGVLTEKQLIGEYLLKISNLITNFTKDSSKSSCLKNLENHFGRKLREVVASLLQNESWDHVLQQLEVALKPEELSQQNSLKHIEISQQIIKPSEKTLPTEKQLSNKGNLQPPTEEVPSRLSKNASDMIDSFNKDERNDITEQKSEKAIPNKNTSRDSIIDRLMLNDPALGALDCPSSTKPVQNPPVPMTQNVLQFRSLSPRQGVTRSPQIAAHQHIPYQRLENTKPYPTLKTSHSPSPSRVRMNSGVEPQAKPIVFGHQNQDSSRSRINSNFSFQRTFFSPEIERTSHRCVTPVRVSKRNQNRQNSSGRSALNLARSQKENIKSNTCNSPHGLSPQRQELNSKQYRSPAKVNFTHSRQNSNILPENYSPSMNKLTHNQLKSPRNEKLEDKVKVHKAKPIVFETLKPINPPEIMNINDYQYVVKSKPDQSSESRNTATKQLSSNKKMPPHQSNFLGEDFQMLELSFAKQQSPKNKEIYGRLTNKENFASFGKIISEKNNRKIQNQPISRNYEDRIRFQGSESKKQSKMLSPKISKVKEVNSETYLVHAPPSMQNTDSFALGLGSVESSEFGQLRSPSKIGSKSILISEKDKIQHSRLGKSPKLIENDQQNPRQKLLFSCGGYYIGAVSKNMMHGDGQLYYPSNRLAYTGEFQYNKFHGEGHLFAESPSELNLFDYRDFGSIESSEETIKQNSFLLQQCSSKADYPSSIPKTINKKKSFWQQYVGQFCHDMKHGKGTLVLTSGERYEGDFMNDFVHGEGKFYSKAGKVIKGVWKENMLTQILP